VQHFQSITFGNIKSLFNTPTFHTRKLQYELDILELIIATLVEPDGCAGTTGTYIENNYCPSLSDFGHTATLIANNKAEQFPAPGS
jgi:hypothetical protein